MDNPINEEELLKILKETMKNELNIDEKNIQKKLITISKWGCRDELNKEANKILKDIKSNMTFINILKHSIKIMIVLILFFYWIVGFVLAKGFWSTFFCIIPFYAWYLVAEVYINKFGNF